MDNAEIAKEALAAMDQNFAIALPNATTRVTERLEGRACSGRVNSIA